MGPTDEERDEAVAAEAEAEEASTREDDSLLKRIGRSFVEDTDDD